ncbi:MAG TPA: cupredoxin domain-containing protein [Gaiellaceae bacterium]|nr:cupredoxin domain-containing protein [Gaiellaceae bacterium]
MRRIAVLIGACLALAGCGGGGKSTPSPATSGSPQQTVTISEAEFSVTPNAVDVGRPGTVAFKVRNIGHIAHALEIEGNGVEEKTSSIQPGQSATLTVELAKAGSYEMYCPIDGHEDKGMKGAITVAGSAGMGGGTTTEGTTTNKGPGY